MRFDNEEASPGLKRGGVLNVVVHELEIVCDAAHIPAEIHIPLDGLEIGDLIHISAVKLPNGVTPANTEDDFTVATIVAPSAMKAEEEETAPADAVPTVEGEEAGRRRRSCRGRRRSLSFSRIEIRSRSAERLGGFFLAQAPASAPHAIVGRPRKSRYEIRASPAQCRLHGGGRHRRGATTSDRGRRSSAVWSPRGVSAVIGSCS